MFGPFIYATIKTVVRITTDASILKVGELIEDAVNPKKKRKRKY